MYFIANVKCYLIKKKHRNIRLCSVESSIHLYLINFVQTMRKGESRQPRLKICFVIFMCVVINILISSRNFFITKVIPAKFELAQVLFPVIASCSIEFKHSLRCCAG